MKRALEIVVACALVVGGSTRAGAADGKLELGIACVASPVGRLWTGAGWEWRDESSATVPGLGIGLRVQYEVLRYLAIGGQVDARWWSTHMDFNRETTEHLPDRHVFLDVAFRIAPKLPLHPNGLELSLALPIGFSTAFLQSGRRTALRSLLGGKPAPGLGFNVAALLGLAYPIAGRFGGFVELGWAYHGMRYTAPGHDAPRLSESLHELDVRFGFACRL